MREDYQVRGKTQELAVKIESSVAQKLEKMCQHTGLSESEIVNTALERFIATHKDFFPSAAKRA